MFNFLLLLVLFLGCTGEEPPVHYYEVSDDLGFGRMFDGIGGLSGGGATSKLLVNYKEPQKSQILDYLFKPKFGASLQILKVEIGGDDQSTDGTEASHMHEEWEENYNRGYEWWLMKEAKKRNPSIKLAGLSWAWPNWLRDKNNQPYKNNEKTAMYTVKWIIGAKQHHNLTIDYIGIWNERPCDLDYILILKRALFENKLDNVGIIGCDSWWDSLDPFLSNETLHSALYAFGVHYPGTGSPKTAIESNLTLWASEDYSTFNNEVGAGCWARILNQNYVNGYMTSTIAWNLITSYYFGLPFEGDGLMTAVEPWSGHYEVKSPIWVSAHTTQFTEIGWRYLKHGHGCGLLANGGSYVSLVSPDGQDLTIVIETMSHDHSICIRPDLPAYNVSRQSATFKFGGRFAKLQKLNVWVTQLRYNGGQSQTFENKDTLHIINNKFSVDLEVDGIYTFSTIGNAQKGYAGEVPKAFPFPLPYTDDFQSYNINEEPYNLSPQVGTWEILKDESTNFKYARQMVTKQPVAWCDIQSSPIALIGNPTWSAMNISAKVRFPSVNSTESVFVATHIRTTGCAFGATTGFFFWVNRKFPGYVITTDMSAKTTLGLGLLKTRPESNSWMTLSLEVKNNNLLAKINHVVVTNLTLTSDMGLMPQQGFAAIGSSTFGYSDWAYLSLKLP